MIIKKSFYIETYGCTFNQSDSERIQKHLIDNDFIPTAFEHAEFIIINTCAVKGQTQDKILSRIENLRKYDKKIVIAGCLPWISEKLRKYIIGLNHNIIGIIGLHSINEIDEIFLKKNDTKTIIVHEPDHYLDKSKIYPWRENNNSVGIVPICEGCNRQCTFCCTTISRGSLYCYEPKNILDQVGQFLKANCKEIYLTSQDCGFYQYEGKDLADIIYQIDQEYRDEDFFLRIGMLDPSYLKKRMDYLMHQIINSDKVYKFLHIPIQSASDKVLNKMNRAYKKKDIEEIFKKLRNNFELTVSTDIICGFPEETESDFEETIQFVEKYKPEIINISKFTPRPNTKAQKFKQTDSKIVKKRTEELTEIYLGYLNSINEKWLNWEGKVLIEKFNPRKEYQYSGRNINYKPVLLKKGKLNEFVNLQVIEINKSYLIGKILD